MYLINEAIFEVHDKHQTPFWVAPYTVILVNIIAESCGKIKWIESESFPVQRALTWPSNKIF